MTKNRAPSREKIWVGIKRGLIRDPKHRKAMGELRWLFDYMVDIANWETGMIEGWTDESAAEDMEMPLRTLREQRRKLDSLNYITCKQNQHNQDIIIHKWVNPRSFSGEVINIQGDALLPPKKIIQGDGQGDGQGSSQDGTPTSDSQSHMSLNDNERTALLAKLYEDNITLMTPLMADIIKDAAMEYTDSSWYKPAFEIAVTNNSRNWRYVETVLKNWKEKGRDWTPPKYVKGKAQKVEMQPEAIDEVELEALRNQAEKNFKVEVLI